MMSKQVVIFLSCLGLLVSFFSLVDAQSGRGNGKVIITHISPYGSSYQGDDPNDPRVEVKNVERSPNQNDVVDAKKKGKKVGMVIRLTGGSHAVTIVGINITPRVFFDNSTNVTWRQRDVLVYDPQTNSSYNLTLTERNGSRGPMYLSWKGWAQVTEVVTVQKLSPVVVPRKLKQAKFEKFGVVIPLFMSRFFRRRFILR